MTDTLSFGTDCHACGQHIEKHKITFTQGYLTVLARLIHHVEGSTINRFKFSDLGLSHTALCNANRLKYWGLVAKIEQTYWCVTRRGFQFFYGWQGIHATLETYNDHVWDATREDWPIDRKSVV